MIKVVAAAVGPKAAVAAAVTTLALGTTVAMNAQAALRRSEAELALWQSGVRRFCEVVDVETDQVSQGCIDNPEPKRKRFAPALQQEPIVIRRYTCEGERRAVQCARRAGPHARRPRRIAGPF